MVSAGCNVGELPLLPTLHEILLFSRRDDEHESVYFCLQERELPLYMSNPLSSVTVYVIL